MRVAIVEDDQAVSLELIEAMALKGGTSHVFRDARSFLHSLARESFDACIVDFNLPGMGVRAFVHCLHQGEHALPVLVLTDRGKEFDVIETLDNRSDDFLVRPVRPGELQARLNALVTRAAPGSVNGILFEYDRFEFNVNTLEVKDRGVSVPLTHKEFELGVLLLRNVGKPLSRGHIKEAVWGRNSDIPSRTLDTHVSRVRTKLSLRPEGGYLLAPVYSYGYRLEHLNAGGCDV